MIIGQDDIQLWIDGSFEYSSIALSKSGQLIDSWISDREKGHVEDIPVQTMMMLERHECSISELSAITVCSGPGSYTGLRISYAWVLGLTSPYDIPFYEYSRPEIIRNHFVSQDYPILIHARRDDYRVWAHTSSGWEEESTSSADLLSKIYLSDEKIEIPGIEVREFTRSAADLFKCYRSGVKRKYSSHPVYFSPPYITKSKKALF